MSNVTLLSLSAEEDHRTLVYETRYNDSIVIMQQKRVDDEWQNTSHIMVHKSVMDAIQLFRIENRNPTGVSVPCREQQVEMLKTYVTDHVAFLSKPTRERLYLYDESCIPLYENQLHYFDASESLESFWGLIGSTMTSPEHPSTPVSQETILATPTAIIKRLEPTSSPESQCTPPIHACFAPKKPKVEKEFEPVTGVRLDFDEL